MRTSLGWRPNSIRARMTLGFALFIAGLMLAMCLAFFVYTKRADRHDADARLQAAAQEIKRELAEGDKNFAALMREESEDLRAADVAILVLDANQRVIAQSQREVPHWPPVGDAWRTISFRSGAHTFVVGVEWHEIEQTLRERALFLLAMSVLVIAFSSLAAWFLVGRTLSPIDNLARQAQTASTENLRVQLQTPSPDAEITRLVSTLNDLLARLAETAAMRGRFYAAASHELRTPLQALTGHLEVALSRQRDAENYRNALDESHTQAERLTSLVQDLLLLNQLDADTARPPGVELDIADMIVSELSLLHALTEQRHLTLELALPQNCEIIAPWNHATMLIRNLLENAIKYATTNSTVRVKLADNTLSIYNAGEPLAGWESGQYFEPFFRPDAARDSQTGGNGLGLAICKAIADSNGWNLQLKQHDNQICAQVKFGNAA